MDNFDLILTQMMLNRIAGMLQQDIWPCLSTRQTSHLTHIHVASYTKPMNGVSKILVKQIENGNRIRNNQWKISGEVTQQRVNSTSIDSSAMTKFPSLWFKQSQVTLQTVSQSFLYPVKNEYPLQKQVMSNQNQPSCKKMGRL